MYSCFSSEIKWIWSHAERLEHRGVLCRVVDPTGRLVDHVRNLRISKELIRCSALLGISLFTSAAGRHWGSPEN